VRYGGCDWSVVRHFIWQAELARSGAPALSPMGIGMCGPALIGHGLPAQKEHYLPRILSGEDFWCQGYSEPHAGSDLAALTMSAVRHGDEFVCNGVKVWTTHAHEANRMFCLVRTARTPRPQEGVTFLLIDMTAPGVRVDPIPMLTGEHIQNTVWFDDVRVPVANVVGEVDKGWSVAKSLLDFERGGAAYAPRLRSRLTGVRAAFASSGAGDANVARNIAEAETDIVALEFNELRSMAALSSGAPAGARASMMKVIGAEIYQRLSEIALDIAGLDACPYQPNHTRPGGPTPYFDKALDAQIGPDYAVTAGARYFNDRAASIYGGSNEIQRNILAKALTQR